MFFIQGLCSKRFLSVGLCLCLFIVTLSTEKFSDLLHHWTCPATSHRRAYPKEAFVILINSQKNYVQLLDVLLDSIHLFSSRSTIVFSIDFHLAVNRTRHPRVTVEHISQRQCGPDVYACKLFAMISSEVDYGVQLEVDSVVNYPIDLLFEMLHVWPYSLPLAPKHPNDPKNYRSYLEEHHVKRQTTPYMHGTFVWTFRAYPFLRRVLRLLQRGMFLSANLDETAMNVMLWKAKTTHVLCKYDPFGPIYWSKYEVSQRSPDCLPHCDGLYLIFHGQKESSVSETIFKRLQNLGRNHPFVQTSRGLQSFQDTNVTCCHPSATRPSALHPLLCEYHNYQKV